MARTLPSTFPSYLILAGKRRHGKDTVAEILCQEYEHVVLINYSDPIIDEVNEMLAVHDLRVTEDNKDDYRPLLQWWGQYRRAQNPTYFLERMQETAASHLQQGAQLIIFCGARQPATDIVPLPAYPTVKVHRPMLQNDSEVDTHINETSLDSYPFTYVIVNHEGSDWHERLRNDTLQLVEAINNSV